MKKILYYSFLLLAFAVCLEFTACSDDTDDNNGGQVRFESFGPSPALRGGKLTFIGKNMDKVTKIILPDNIEITDIEVIDNEHIKITIPQNAQVGYVKLITPNGEFTSKTLLTYTEPISITKIAPSPIKAGEKLTIEGDYLNLIQKVVFKENVEILCKDFVTWERAKIELILPREAQSGIIILADTAAIPLELESEMELQVVLPSVENTLNLTNKKPGDVITVPGADLDLVEEVLSPDGESIPFEVADNVLSFILPTGITDGAIVMVAASGVRVAVANIGMAVPSELVVTPTTDIKAGDEISIKGINMDLVTTLVFPGLTDPVTPTSKSATEIKVTMPEAAISGDLVLNTASGNKVTVAIVTLKPEVLAYNPSPVAAGSSVELQGKHLDLVVSVTFGGNKKVEVYTTTADKLSVTVPVDAETGKITLTMKNGETVECSSLEITKPVFAYIPVLPGSDEEIKAGTIWAVDIENGDKLTDVQVNGSTTQYILQGSKLYILIPNNAGGNTKVKLISSNGEVEYTINVIGSSSIETIVFQGPVDLTWGDDGRAVVPSSAFDGVGAGSILKIYFTQKEAWGQAQINDGGWAQIPWPELGGSGTITTDTYGDKSVGEQEFVLTQDILNLLDSKKGIYGTYSDTDPVSIIIQGSDWIITKISIITKGGATSEVIWEGNTVFGTDWGSYVQLNDPALFANAKVGKTLAVTVKDLDMSQAWWQVLLKDSSWADIPGGKAELASNATGCEYPIDQTLLDIMQAGGIIIGGYANTITKVEIK
jgi:hypothetical protein